MYYTMPAGLSKLLERFRKVSFDKVCLPVLAGPLHAPLTPAPSALA